MKSLEINNDNLNNNEINEIVTRVKVFLLNSRNELLVASSNGGCQLPGGHVEKGEDFFDSVKREVMEETGIVLDNSEIHDAFFEILHKTRNHRGSGKNRLSNVIYYLVRTDKPVNENNISLTENEKEYNFKVDYVKVEQFEDYVRGFINSTQSEVNKIIAGEMLTAFGELKKLI